MDYLNIGPSPASEDCAQLGKPDFYEQAKKECQAFKAQLIRAFGEPPQGARIASKAFQHDFGTYYEVVCYYQEDLEEAVDYAFKLENEMPEVWDEQAKEVLAV